MISLVDRLSFLTKPANWIVASSDLTSSTEFSEKIKDVAETILIVRILFYSDLNYVYPAPSILTKRLIAWLSYISPLRIS